MIADFLHLLVFLALVALAIGSASAADQAEDRDTRRIYLAMLAGFALLAGYTW